VLHVLVLDVRILSGNPGRLVREAKTVSREGVGSCKSADCIGESVERFWEKIKAG
jgi:hypothetical protein